MKPLLIVLVMLSQLAAPQFPQAELSNASIRATLYLPDAKSGTTGAHASTGPV